MTVAAIIPAYNEEASIVSVIKRVRHFLPAAAIVVMNDGSRDATARLARSAGAVVLDLPFNLGIGGAVQTGLKYAYRAGFEVAIEIDADGQHDPEYAPRLIAALHEHQADMVIGSRFVASSSYRSSRLRRFGTHLFSFLIHRVTGKRIYDSTSGFRAYSRPALAMLSAHYPVDFPEPESIVMLLANGYAIRELPVEMQERTTGTSVVRSDLSLKAAYFVVSNAIAITLTGFKARFRHGRS